MRRLFLWRPVLCLAILYGLSALGVLLGAPLDVVAVGLLALTFLVLVLQNLRYGQTVRRVAEFARAIAQGQLEHPLGLQGPEELHRSLRDMAAELREAVRLSQEEKRRLEVILRSIPDALLILDAKGSIQMASAASREFFGQDSPITGRPFWEVVRNHEFSAMLQEARQGGTLKEAELRLEHPRERYATVRLLPLFEEGLSGFFVAVFHDTTQLKRLEEMRKDFVANVSHELKTPIAAIRGFADTLLEGALKEPEAAQRFLQTIKSHSERINALVDDLMTISKIELGVIRVQKAPVDVKEVLEGVFGILGPKAQAKGLYLRAQVPEALRVIQADRDRLTQILTNLLDNAIKFTERGGVVAGLAQQEGRRCLFVKDTGIGIEAKHLPRLGERFYRVEPSRSRALGGTGLGLAIVKHLVRAHGWELRFHSQPGAGTEVRIFIV